MCRHRHRRPVGAHVRAFRVFVTSRAATLRSHGAGPWTSTVAMATTGSRIVAVCAPAAAWSRCPEGVSRASGTWSGSPAGRPRRSRAAWRQRDPGAVLRSAVWSGCLGGRCWGDRRCGGVVTRSRCVRSCRRHGDGERPRNRNVVPHRCCRRRQEHTRSPCVCCACCGRRWRHTQTGMVRIGRAKQAGEVP